MQIQNLLYVVGALAVASLISGLYVLRHRKPKSLEAGIESFSRELKALAPERRSASGRDQPSGRDDRSREDGTPARTHPTVQTVVSRTAEGPPADRPEAPAGQTQAVDPGRGQGSHGAADPPVDAEHPSRGEGG